MDPIRNPYAPGAGTPPPELAGRAEVLAAGTTAVKRVAAGRTAQSLILVGLRGVGKTVLLNRLAEIAKEQDCNAIFVEAQEGNTLGDLLVPGLRNVVYSLSSRENLKEKTRRAFRVLRGFMGAIKFTINELDIALTVDPERGTADSGRIESDFPELLSVVGDLAKAAAKPIIIFVDELQFLSQKDFSALIMGIHRTNQLVQPVLLVGAGLPQIHGLAGNSKSYSERLFRFPDIGALSYPDARVALVNPAQAEGARFSEEALKRIFLLTERYPYFLQQWAYESWNVAEQTTISEQNVGSATELAVRELDKSFFKVRFDRCTPTEKKYMRALAELGSGKHRSGDIADTLRVKVTSVAPTRNNLIKKGMIFSPAHGDTEFTVPLFDQFMRRVMPSWSPLTDDE